jgi:hypothetical protein
MKIAGITAAGILILVMVFGLLFLIRFITPEDDWILNDRGVWIKHGAPANTPSYVTEQQEAINCAGNLYQQRKTEGMQFNSQCLGKCGNYAVDIVNVPRNEEDNKGENQCVDYQLGIVGKFIELDKYGEIVRIA